MTTRTVRTRAMTTNECTGATAAWCPVHGDCACPRTDGGPSLDHPACPLHGPASTHGEEPEPTLAPAMLACLRGEHEDSGAWISNQGLVFASLSGTPQRGIHMVVKMCRHCRSVFVPRAT